MTFTEAALLVLRLTGKPLHYKEITDVAIERSLLSHVGKNPEVTMGARLAAQVKNADTSNPLKRVKPGVFALAEWDEQTIERGLEDRTPALTLVKKAEEEQGIQLQDLTEAGPADPLEGDLGEVAEPQVEAGDENVPSPDRDEQHRAELSAGASDLFASEDDDDQPIFGAPEPEVEAVESDDKAEGKRRRRRRRGRGRREEELSSDEEGDDLPGYTVSDAEPSEVLAVEEAVAPVIEDAAPQLEVGLADAIYQSLSKQGPARGGVPLQSLAESLRKKFRAELGLSGPALLAVAVADNLARERSAQLPRFRVHGTQLALTDWGHDRKFAEKCEELSRAAEHLQRSTQRALVEELRKLQQRAVGELVLVLLGRMGVDGISVIRRPGSHGSELHLSGYLTQSGALRTSVALVIRRDARDVGREKVTELRGALHHYGHPTVGWIITTGQVLSGAKEEAHAPGATPVTLTGRNELADLFIAHGIGVRTQRIEVPVVDTALFEGLSGR
jgi:restriction endonuclease Mrr